MDKIYVFSKNPLIGANGREPAAERFGDVIRYEFAASGETDDIKDLVFNATALAVTQKQLKKRRLHFSGDAPALDTFSQKLTAYLTVTGKKDKIDEIIRSVLLERGALDIEGLITFRLKELSSDISAFFDLLYYEYSVQRQYDDFVTLLRDYVRLEAPREETLHIVFRGEGFVLYNSKKANITYQALKHYGNDSNFTEGNLNDFLISSLLHYLPKTVILHSEPRESVRIAETIRLIFGERATRCGNAACELCENEAEGGALGCEL